MPLLQRKRVIAIKEELDGSSNHSYALNTIDPGNSDVIEVTELSITPQAGDVVSRGLIKPFMGGVQQLLTNTRVECNFTVEMVGLPDPTTNALGAPVYDAALRACGLNKTASGDPVDTNSYKPISENVTSICIEYNVDGVLHTVRGCRGTFSINCTVGEIPKIAFSFTGIYVAPTSPGISFSGLSYPTTAEPKIFKSSNLTGNLSVFGNSHNPLLQSFTLDFGNTVIYRELVGSSTPQILITDRTITGTAVVEAPLTSSKDYFAEAITHNQALQTIGFTHGTVTGNKIKIESEKADLTNVTYEESDGIVMLNLPFTLIATAATSSDDQTDDLEIAFT